MPSGIDTSNTLDGSIIVQNNRVVGVEGSCFSGSGTECDESESCSAQSSRVVKMT